VLLAAALATGQPGPVLAATPVRDAAPAASPAQGWDAITIPGWQVAGRPAYRRPLWHPGISGNRQILAG
jgi:hypothetical protein